MSTFTQFNGPQGSSGPSTKDITALIDAYNQLSIKLTAHIEALAPTDSTVHGIMNYVTDIKTQLETLIGAKAGNSDLKDVRTIAEAAATQSELNSAIQSLNSLIADKASVEDIESKADTTDVTAIKKDIETLTSTLNALDTNFLASRKEYSLDSLSVSLTAISYICIFFKPNFSLFKSIYLYILSKLLLTVSIKS